MSIFFNRSCSFNVRTLFKVKCSDSNIKTLSRSSSQQTEGEHKHKDDEFRVLDLKPKKSGIRRQKGKRTEVMPPRSLSMPVDQDWTNVWPGPRVFHPATIPLPLRQGYSKKGVAPGKFGNAELMKIPNFLHLTPPAIKKHCEALKKFCTAWPAGLETDEKCKKEFPLEVYTTDYCHSSPVIRDPLSRIVTIKVKLDRLPLDAHARDKFLRLVGERYNPETDILTIVTDRCPLRQQNYDYAHYLLTALFHESWKVEPWESEKSEADMEYYDWDKSASQKGITAFSNWLVDQKLEPLKEEHISEYKEAVSELMNEGEDEYTLNKYKEKVKQLLFPAGALEDSN